MGGNALKKVSTRRYARDEYLEVCVELIEKCKLIFQDATIPPSYRSKESFGDVDIVCKYDEAPYLIKERIIEVFNPTEIVQGGNVFSLDYKGIQIDLIITHSDLYETSCVYFSYNDIHNLIGKIAHKFGLKWGFNGLVYPYRNEGKMLGDITLTKDHHTALRFFDLDPQIYDNGFESLNDMFNYVIGSKYFTKDAYALENLNSINRHRDRRRKVYQAFIEFLGITKISSDKFNFSSDKTIYFDHIDEAFPGFKKELARLDEISSKREQAKKLFNGTILLEEFNWVNTSNIGSMINKFNSNFSSNEEKVDWILKNGKDAALRKFKEINR